MGFLTFDALLRSVKKGVLDPVYYLHGDEDVLKSEAIRTLCGAALDPAARDFNFDQRSASQLDPEGLYTLLNTPPMLAERRVVIVRDIVDLRRKSKVRDELLRYLARPSPSTLLILVDSTGEEPDEEIGRQATSVTVDRLPPERVARWAAYRATELGISLEPDAAELLVQAAGDDLGILGQELEKLAGLTRQGSVKRDTVAGLVGIRHGETVHDLVDAVLDRQPARAARLVEGVLGAGGMTGVRLVGALGTVLVGTALARAELDAGASRARLSSIMFGHLQSARPFGLRSWRDEAARWARWAERWTASDLARALRLARDADRALKSTTVTRESGIVMQLVLSLGSDVREAA
jgi:DNA polymerase-3 subunit delta